MNLHKYRTLWKHVSDRWQKSAMKTSYFVEIKRNEFFLFHFIVNLNVIIISILNEKESLSSASLPPHLPPQNFSSSSIESLGTTPFQNLMWCHAIAKPGLIVGLWWMILQIELKTLAKISEFPHVNLTYFPEVMIIKKRERERKIEREKKGESIVDYIYVFWVT